MKCTACHAAEPVIKYDGEVPYWYKGHVTSIHGVSLYTCPRCGNESIPPGRVQEWLEQTAAFRAAIDAKELDEVARPSSMKDSIIVEWLDLDPAKLAAEVPLEHDGYIRWTTLSHYAEQQKSKVFEAFAAYKGSHTTNRAGCSYLQDWEEFLAALTRARAIAADPYWEVPRDGVVYRCPV
jgi:YgiT-type zinc finger domain-containing protein